MKKQFAGLIAVVFASISMVHAQAPQDPGTPSGAEVPQPPAAGDAAAQQQPEITVTVSQTFTNQTNSITVIGTVDRAEDKTAVEQSLKQALPGKQINNQLKVAAKEDEAQLNEPAGAETPDDKDTEEEVEIEVDEVVPQAQPQTELEPEANDESDTQP